MESRENITEQVQQEKECTIIFKKRKNLAYFEKLITSPNTWLIRESRKEGMISVTYFKEDKGEAYHLRYAFDVNINQWVFVSDEDVENYLSGKEQIKKLNKSNIGQAFPQLMALLAKHGFNIFGIIAPKQKESSRSIHYINYTYILPEVINNPLLPLQKIEEQLDIKIKGLKEKNSLSMTLKIYPILDNKLKTEFHNWLIKNAGNFNIAIQDLEDAVTMELFTDPVILETGLVYERASCYKSTGELIEICPLTSQELNPDQEPITLPGYEDKFKTCFAKYLELMKLEQLNTKEEEEEKEGEEEEEETKETKAICIPAANKNSLKHYGLFGQTNFENSLHQDAEKQWSQLSIELQRALSLVTYNARQVMGNLSEQGFWDHLNHNERVILIKETLDSASIDKNAYNRG